MVGGQILDAIGELSALIRHQDHHCHSSFMSINGSGVVGASTGATWTPEAAAPYSDFDSVNGVGLSASEYSLPFSLKAWNPY